MTAPNPIGHINPHVTVAAPARRGFVSRPRRAFSHSRSVAPISPDARSQIVHQSEALRLHVPTMTLETVFDAPEFRV